MKKKLLIGLPIIGVIAIAGLTLAMRDGGVEGIEVEIEKVTDIAEIMAYGVMSTPGVVVDDKVVHAGGIPGPDQVRAWVRE